MKAYQRGVRRVFWDIETSPNVMFSWRCGGKIYLDPDNIIQERAIICICWKFEGEKKVHSLAWKDGDDRKMLQEFAKVIDRADELVAHNGDKFDLRWFNGRTLIHDLPPVPPTKTVDTLKIALRHFYLNSNRLDYLAKILFGEGKMKTDFGLWRGVVKLTEPVAAKRKQNLSKMVRYCKKDVTLLERVWNKLRDYEAPMTHAAVLATGDHKDRWMCPHCASANVFKNQTRATTKGMIQHQMKCKDCGRYYQIANAVYGYYTEAKRRERLKKARERAEARRKARRARGKKDNETKGST